MKRLVSLSSKILEKLGVIDSVSDVVASMFNYSPMGMILIGTNLRVEFINDAASQLLGLRRSASTGRHVSSLFNSKSKILAEKIERIVTKKSQMETIEHFRTTARDEHARLIDVFAYPIVTRSLELSHIVIVLRDSTRRYQLETRLAFAKKENAAALERRVEIAVKELRGTIEELSRANKLKSEFVSTISHELRTPLTSIKGYVSLLANKKLGPLTTPQEESLLILKQETDRLGTLINDILDFSRLESGKTTLKLSVFDVRQLLDELSVFFEPQYRAKQMSVLTKGDPCKLHADRDKIKQVLENLVTNAIKYSNERTTVRMSVSEKKGTVQIMIADEGMGIPANDLPHVFDSFYRSSIVQDHQIGGTGLGLTIAKHIIDLHKGSITVKSKVGKGSVFTMTLPDGQH